MVVVEEMTVEPLGEMMVEQMGETVNEPRQVKQAGNGMPLNRSEA